MPRFLPCGISSWFSRDPIAAIVLVIGGRDADGNALGSAELFDPTNGTFTSTGGMNTPRESHTTTLLNDGKVLIAPGGSGTERLATAELFDAASGSFMPTSDMASARDRHLPFCCRTVGCS
jgi:hypothetical protein